MTLAEVLEACRRPPGVSLRLVDGEPRQSGANAELLVELRAHRAEVKAIVGSKSFPWLGFVGFALERACCACGQAPYIFLESGEGKCLVHAGKQPAGWEYVKGGA